MLVVLVTVSQGLKVILEAFRQNNEWVSPDVRVMFMYLWLFWMLRGRGSVSGHIVTSLSYRFCTTTQLCFSRGEAVLDIYIF